MAKRQTRRSISVKGITYQRLKDYCEASGLSVSGYLEDIIAEKLDAAGVPVPTVVKARPQPKLGGDVEEIVSQHFTF
ncbi:MAG: hypothetical protein KC420_06630 [Myxococcales bacterium]|nr:hypothetical protein [Myxococcales bacterium]MCB9566733.1 hypothetical protein [Myxococcales bacterium]MCB9704469.1 hypothetical protein [Myxococcales bacterium]